MIYTGGCSPTELCDVLVGLPYIYQAYDFKTSWLLTRVSKGEGENFYIENLYLAADPPIA